MAKRVYGTLEVRGKVKLPNETINRVPTVDANGEITSSATTSTELGYLSGVTSSIQTQLDNAQNAADAAQLDIDNHIADATDAHDASAISNIPTGNLAATDVQSALNELQSDIDTRALDADVIKKDGSVAFTGDQSMGGFKLTSLAAPTASSDAATKGYVDNALEGLRPKEAVRVASTANIDLTTGGLLTVDGITLVANDRVLVKNQTLPEQNGIYDAKVGSWVRSSDFDSLSPIDEINKAYVAVQEGTTNAGKLYVQFGDVNILGTDPINFTFFNSVSGLVGGDGITVSGSNISVDHDGEGLTFVATQLALELDGATLAKSSAGLKLSDTAVTPGSFGSATETVSITVDQQGRLTAASEQLIDIPSTQVNDFVEAAQDAVGTILTDSADVDFTYNDATPSITAVLTTTGVVADTYGDATNIPQITVDSKGRITNVVDIPVTITDELVKVSANDTTPGYLEQKVVEGSGIDVAVLNDGGDEDLQISLDINGLTEEISPAAGDFIAIYDTSATANRKMSRANFLGPVAPSPGDIAETSFSFNNNQVTFANITGFNFNNAVVRSFSAQVSVAIDADSDLFENFEINGIQKASSWEISVESTGDVSGVLFDITSAGQVQYTSENKTGFVSGTMKFRATVTGV